MHRETLALLPPGHYVFTEAVLAAAESTPLFRQWVDQAFRDESGLERVHTYFQRMVGVTATTEDEMALVKLGGNNMGGGVPADILRLLARLSRVGP